jgi:hypothetical protein
MALSKIELSLKFTSRFKQTRLYVKFGRAFFGTYRALEVQMDGDEETLPVQQGQEGQLDLFAKEVYGTRELWPVIAEANHIKFPYEEVVAGMSLIIPKPANVRAALLKLQRRSVRSTG